MMKNFDAAIEQKIKTFVGELHALVRQAAVDAVRDALGGKDAGVARPRPQRGSSKKAAAAPRRKAAPVKGGRRSPEQLARTVAKVRQHVKDNPGQTVEVISKALGVPTRGLALPLAKLIKRQEVRKSGVKRNTKYFPAETKTRSTKK
jgi:hypothetical protein